jgi:hypothetical protein
MVVEEMNRKQEKQSNIQIVRDSDRESRALKPNSVI